MNNTALWQKFENTDPKTTKGFSRGGGFNGTAINATSIQKKLTEEFGPCGMGWRFVLEDDRVEEGHKLKSGDFCKLHIVRGHLEYFMFDRWHSTGPQFGQTYLVGEYSSGTYTDEEAPKKSITDCIGKCAATLGIGADIYLGLFDDNKYVNDATKRDEPTKLEKAAAKSPAKPKTVSPREAFVVRAQERYAECKECSDFLRVANEIADKMKKHKDDPQLVKDCLNQWRHSIDQMLPGEEAIVEGHVNKLTGEDWDETKEQAKDVF
jgi:hypothetical protein